MLRSPLWLAAVIALAMATARPAHAAEELIDGIAAQVGSDVVLISEVTRVTGPMEDKMVQAGATQKDVAMIRTDMLERLIERRLVEQVVRRMELEASDAEVDGAIGAIAQENGLTMDQLRESLDSHAVDWEEYREKIRGEIQRSKILNGMVRSKVKVEESAVEALYAERYSLQRKGGQEMHLRHFVSVGGNDGPRSIEEACERVRTAQVRIDGGESFADLAREMSDTNARNGGDVGWVHEEDIAPWMADAVRDLPVGGLSEAIEMPFGCNLFQVVERRGFERVEFEQVHEELFMELYNQGLETEYEKWMDELRTQTYIERKGVFAQAARLGGNEPRDRTKVEGQQGLAPIDF